MSGTHLNHPIIETSLRPQSSIVLRLCFEQSKPRHPVSAINRRVLFISSTAAAKHGKPVGMKNLLKQIKKVFPDLKYGYFNPPKEKFGVKNTK